MTENRSNHHDAAPGTDAQDPADVDFLKAVIDAMVCPVFVKDNRHRWIMLNQAFCDLIGRSRDELLGRSDFEVLSEQESTVFWDRDDQVLTTGQPNVNEERITGTDDRTRIIETKKSLHIDPNGRRFIVGVIQDITERKHAEAELGKANIRLEAANEELEAFAFAVSHDLRAPLQRIQGCSQIVADALTSSRDETVRDCIHRIQRSIRRMGDLISALLSLSHMGRLEIALDEINLSRIAREEFADLESASAPSSTEFSVHPGMVAYGDPRLARSILKNLLSNAWKFSADSNPSIIECGRLTDEETARTEHAGKSVFFVRDNGIGFDMRNADELFRPFKRLHTEADYPGIGIGLTTVRRIVRRHGGETWIESGPGTGTTVYFTLA